MFKLAHPWLRFYLLDHLNRPLMFLAKQCSGADLGGGSRGCAPPPPPPEMTCGFLIQLVFCKKKKMWFIGVKVEQETSAPPPKKTLDPHPNCCNAVLHESGRCESSRVASPLVCARYFSQCSRFLFCGFNRTVSLIHCRCIHRQLLRRKSWLPS